MHYGISKKTSLSFDEAVKKVTDLLKKQKFGILTEVNVQEKMKEKLGKDMERYIILGACSPPSAFEAIANEVEIGLLLPCNVIVYQNKNDVFVSAVRPTVLMSLVENSVLRRIAIDIERTLSDVIADV